MGKRRKNLRRQQLRASTLDALVPSPVKETKVPKKVVEPVPAAPEPPVVEEPPAPEEPPAAEEPKLVTARSPRRRRKPASEKEE